MNRVTIGWETLDASKRWLGIHYNCILSKLQLVGQTGQTSATLCCCNLGHVQTLMCADPADHTCQLQLTVSLQEMADQSPAARPLRRRAGLLVGQWVGKLKGEDRPLAYRALLSLLADPDPAMQLAAVASLHALIDDWSVSWLSANVHFPRLRMLCLLLACLVQDGTVDCQPHHLLMKG